MIVLTKSAFPICVVIVAVAGEGSQVGPQPIAGHLSSFDCESAVAQTLVVNTLDVDSDPDNDLTSLYEALYQVNHFGGENTTITFSVTGETYTAGESLRANGVTIEGSGAITILDELTVESNDCAIRGLTFTHGPFDRGVVVAASATGNTFGPGNVIGPCGVGLVVAGSRNTIVGNLIGVAMDGTTRRPNYLAGVVISGSDNSIKDNVISGNVHYGIVFLRGGDQNSLVGNLIGVSANRNVPVPNLIGMYMEESRGNVVGATVTNEGRPNTIKFNLGTGIQLDGYASAIIRKNEISQNGGVGIRATFPYPPVIRTNRELSLIEGFALAPHGGIVDLYVDPEDEGGKWFASVQVNETGAFSWQGPIPDGNITATLTSTFLVLGSGYVDSTSAFSPCTDSDVDGLCDYWEEAQGIDLDLDGDIDEGTDIPLDGASVGVKDLFVEIDAMQGVWPSFGNLALTLFDVYVAFQIHGITLHLFPDRLDLPRSDIVAPDAFLRGAPFGTDAEHNNERRSALRWARSLAYRYCMFVHRIPQPCSDGGQTFRSGYALGPWFLIASFGTDFANSNTQKMYSATFMHELGHTLGLEHGGGDDKNYKPNYYSVMNYAWQLPKDYPGWRLDYSDSKWRTIRELNLREEGGFLEDGGCYGPYNVPIGPPNGHTGTFERFVEEIPLNRNTCYIDWNGNRVFDLATPVAIVADVNYIFSDPEFGQRNLPCTPSVGTLGQTLDGHDDWTRVRERGLPLLPVSGGARQTGMPLAPPVIEDTSVESAMAEAGMDLPVIGDVDDDGEIELADVAEFVKCITGPGVQVLPDSCNYFEESDLLGGGDVTLADFWILQARFGRVAP